MAAVERSHDFVLVGYYLAAFGEMRSGKAPSPPREVGTTSWKAAYATFYAALGHGRRLLPFANSLKNTRDAFDSWLDTGRVGWRDADSSRAPMALTKLEQEVLDKYRSWNRERVWSIVKSFADLAVANVPIGVLADLETEGGDERGTTKRTEGGRRVFVSTRIERNPVKRAEALAIHGYDCAVCGFSFKSAYGSWGADYAEVHHLVPLSDSGDIPRDTDARNDLAVLCANCHRMAHRKRKMVLTLAELRAKLTFEMINQVRERHKPTSDIERSSSPAQ